MLKSLLLLVGSFGLAGCSLLSITGANQGALQVTSNADFSVFLDENHLGQTPFFDEKIKVGVYALKLVSISGGGEEWQSQITISKRALTVVNYDFATTPEESSSEILLLEPLSDDSQIRVSISTLPDNVVVKIDDEVKGFSPISLDDIEVGDHVVQLEAPGRKQKTINAKVTGGHHLIIQAQLARDTQLGLEENVVLPVATSSGQVDADQVTPDGDLGANAGPSPSPGVKKTSNSAGDVVDGVTLGEAQPDDLKPPYVRILEASVGIDWLRVRSSASGFVDNEVAKVKVGTYFKFVEESDNSEWYKIEYATGKEGWIASRFADLTSGN